MRVVVGAVLVALCSASGCGDDDESSRADELSRQRAIWEDADIDSYDYSMFWGVFLLTAGDYRVTVVDGQPAGLRRVDGAEVLDAPGAEVPRSFDEVFDVLERELAAERIDATYDDEHGLPLHVLVDRKLSGVDDELEIRISDFTPTE